MKQKLFLPLLGLASIASLLLFLKYRTYAFPEHAINFSINSNQAQEKAGKIADELGIPIKSFEKVTVFDTDDEAKDYLERELGAKKAGELAQEEVDLWHFTTRFFKELTKEELYISIAPDGRLVGLNHLIDESSNGANLSREEAELKAGEYLKQYCDLCIRTGIENWKVVRYTNDKKEGRTDHRIVYERQNFTLKEATQRVAIRLYGDELGQYTEGLKIPEHWTANFDKEKSYNQVAQNIAEFINTLLLTIPLVIIFFRKFRDKKLKLRVPFRIGIVAAAVTLASTVNAGAQYYYDFPTDQAKTTVGALFIFGLALSWIFTLLSTEATVATAESYYAATFPEKKDTFASLKKLFVLPSMKKAVFIGMCVGMLGFAYELVYYIIGKSLGYWVPADVSYNDAFNSIAPWLYPLFIGFLPAISEEAIYRLFGISLYYKLLQKIVSKIPKLNAKVQNTKILLGIAVVGSSMTWAFLHSAYPQMPFFARGLELTIIGIAFSIIFLRYGIIASVAAHYTFNAMQMAIFFLESKSIYASITGLIIALIPLWIVVISTIVQKIFHRQADENEIPDNAASQLPQVTTPQEQKTNTIPVGKLENALPLSGKLKAIFFIASISTIIFVFIPMKNKPESTSSAGQKYVSQSRGEIIKSAEEFVKSQKIDINDYYTVATIESNGVDKEATAYLDENTNEETADYFLKSNRAPSSLWKVRFFIPQQKDSFQVYLKPDGSIYTFNHTLDEDASGPDTTLEEAKKIANTYLKSRIQNLSSFGLISSETNRRKNRTDYRFVYEDNRKVKEASRRITIDVKQGVAQNLDNYIHIPESFERKQSEMKPVEVALQIVFAILAILMIGGVVSALFMVYRNGQLKSRAATNLARLFTLFGAIGIVNNLTTFFANYNADLPLWVHSAIQIISIPISLILTYFLSILALNGAAALHKMYIGKFLPENISDQKKLFGDAIFLTFIIGFSSLFIIYGSSAIGSYFSPKISSSESTSRGLLSSMQTILPVLEGLKDIDRSILVPCLALIFLITLRMYLRSWKLMGIILALLLVTASAISIFTGDFSYAELIALLPLLVYLLAMAVFVVKNNIFFYGISLYYLFVSLNMLTYLLLSSPFWKLNGLLYVVLALLPIVVFLFYEKIADKLITKKQENETSSTQVVDQNTAVQ